MHHGTFQASKAVDPFHSKEEGAQIIYDHHHTT
jgi:hypothetical protein